MNPLSVDVPYAKKLKPRVVSGHEGDIETSFSAFQRYCVLRLRDCCLRCQVADLEDHREEMNIMGDGCGCGDLQVLQIDHICHKIAQRVLPDADECWNSGRFRKHSLGKRHVTKIVAAGNLLYRLFEIIAYFPKVLGLGDLVVVSLLFSIVPVNFNRM